MMRLSLTEHFFNKEWKIIAISQPLPLLSLCGESKGMGIVNHTHIVELTSR